MSVRTPRAWLSVNGGFVELIHCEVVVSRYASPSSYIAVMALDDPSNPGPQFWGSASPIYASIVATNDENGGGKKTLIDGKLDVIQVELEKRKVTVHGSDYTSLMLDTRTDQSWVNKTTSDVVSELARKHGFNLHVDSTGMMAGTTYDGQEYTLLSRNENEWDLIQRLAATDGKVAYIVGRDFYYTDPGNTVGDVFPVAYTPPSKESFAIGNFMTVKLTRQPDLEQIVAASATYNAYDKQAYVGNSTGGDNDGP